MCENPFIHPSIQLITNLSYTFWRVKEHTLDYYITYASWLCLTKSLSLTSYLNKKEVSNFFFLGGGGTCAGLCLCLCEGSVWKVRPPPSATIHYKNCPHICNAFSIFFWIALWKTHMNNPLLSPFLFFCFSYIRNFVVTGSKDYWTTVQPGHNNSSTITQLILKALHRFCHWNIKR